MPFNYLLRVYYYNHLLLSILLEIIIIMLRVLITILIYSGHSLPTTPTSSALIMAVRLLKANVIFDVPFLECAFFEIFSVL